MAEELGVDPVHKAILAEIIPWALGVSDPVQERVETRKREAACE